MKKIYQKKKVRLFFCCVLSLFLLLGHTVVYASVRSASKPDPKIKLSEKEQEYIEKKKNLRVAVLDDWEPISAKKDSGRGYQGLAPDILRYVEEETGLKIEYIRADSYLDAVKMTESGMTDMTAAIIEYPGIELEVTYDLDFTEAYLQSQMMILQSKRVNLREQKVYEVAEVKGYPEFSDNPGLSRMSFATPKDCLLAVSSGQADIMYCDIFTGKSHLMKYNNRELISFPINVEMKFKMGISEIQDPVLKDILDNVITHMSRKEINDSLTRNRVNPMNKFGDFVYNYPFEIICVLLVLSVLAVVISSTYFRVKNRNSIALQGYVKSYCMLADTLGEAGLNYDYAADRMTVFGQCAEKLSMPREIDNFTDYLEGLNKEISLTKEQFKQMLEDGMQGKACDINLECRLHNGEWEHFRLIFSVVSTIESYQRPIYMIGCLNSIEEDFQEKERLLHLGMNDKLTGLLNRAGMEWQVKERLKDSEREKDLLLIVDVDYFKQFNDTYGHICGDEVLIYLGEQLKKNFRKEDVLCRWGGDEFLLYIFGGAEHPEAIRKKCRMLQKSMNAYSYEGRDIPVTLSIGGAAVREKTLEDAFKSADEALYIVKKRGRNDVHLLVK